MFSDATLSLGATAIRDSVTHIQLHSANVGIPWATAAVGTRVAVTGSVDADGDITFTNVLFTGLTPGQVIEGASYWNAVSGGTNRGGVDLTGDNTANAEGEFTIVSITENGNSV